MSLIVSNLPSPSAFKSVASASWLMMSKSICRSASIRSLDTNAVSEAESFSHIELDGMYSATAAAGRPMLIT